MTKSANAQARNKTIVALRREGKTVAELASQFSVSEGTITSALRQAGFLSIRQLPLLERVHARIEYEANTGCWLWPGAFALGGYGSIHDGPRSRLLHIVMWEAVHGPKPDHLQVLHKCDTPACCNPAHLFLGTQTDNMQDCIRKGRHVSQVSPREQRGTSNTQAKLDDEKVRAIRASTGTNAAIARQFDICRRSVRSIRSRHTWSHVE